MPRLSLPPQILQIYQDPKKPPKPWTGIFRGDIAGSIYSGKSIDLERQKGNVLLAETYSDLVNSTQVGFSSLTTPISFLRTSADGTDRYWANAGKLFKSSGADPETGWAQDALANTPAAPLYDLLDVSGAMIVPTDTNLDRLSSGTWTNNWWTGTLSGSSLTSGKPHRLTHFLLGFLITDGNLIHRYDGTIVKSPALTLITGFQADFFIPWNDTYFICGRTTNGAEANVYGWNGIDDEVNNVYPSGDTQVVAGFVVGNVPYIITKKGAVKRFTGQGFETVQQFPCTELGHTISDINPNGIVVEEYTAKILVTFGSSVTNNFGIDEARILDGIWTFDSLETNLYHSGSPRNTNNKDFSQQELAGVGAMALTAIGSGRYLIGAQAYTAYPLSTVYGIYASNESQTSNEGYFFTPRIYSTDINAFWRLLFAKFKQLTSGDRIRVAYRVITSLLFPQYETITWTSATTFTATNPNILAGDFVEVLAGDNAGSIARVVTYAAGVVTIDRTLYASTNPARVRYFRLIDLGTISDQGIETQILRVTDRGSWVQFLIELRGTEASPQISEIVIDWDPLPL